MNRYRRTAVYGLVAIVSVAGLAACGANSSDDSGDGGKTIALLLPETKTTRYESFDKPLFEAKVKELCSDCKVNYLNADQDASKQQQQAESAITDGASVLVLDPVDGKAATGIVKSAQSSDVPVVAYDRFIEGADYYISFDNERVGEMQGEALVKATGDTGDILMLNGSPTDPNAAQFKKGAHSVIDKSGLNVLAEYDNPDWSPDNAQKFTSSQLNNIDPSQLAGVYAANDGQAGGVFAALKAAGVTDFPPITGQDAELAAIQRILAGQQYMTVYKPIKTEADQAAQLAVDLVNGDKPSDTTDFEGVPSYILEPISVTKDNVKDTVVKDKFYSVDDICTTEYADACQSAGLQ
ncbi:sugar ABC transporter substrate-binding protein [Aeromicrobium sp. YIM 150415]|uniref:ABC transporter substrate-binding protein n=1 Tax=Aeromicrobium sp. YIM 150415 TaxID=2803912 RepID=UPI001966270C|nr:sugar ABC transporter substrate-binding protein [Aeromicrobium sp. YIM 150415]MBM9462325.1 sugar ABC transporter substrate-binding protein [Aeromicrobium sp. YIM 150415]